MGVEPTPSAWKAEVLPLNYTRLLNESLGDDPPYPQPNWWRGEDSNLRRLSRQIYSLIPLTTREPLRNELITIQNLVISCQTGKAHTSFV